MRHRPSDESGVILIMVALLILVLMGMSAFAIDHGEAWYARTEAQAAADAGALAGAMTLQHSDPTYPFPEGGKVDQNARALVALNTVRDVAGTAEVLADCPGWVTGTADINCVQVNVYRNGEHDSAGFNTLFANLFGVPTHGVKATATAQIFVATKTNCLKPWFIPDQFIDENGNKEWDAGDTYRPPTDPLPTGYTTTNSLGKEIVLKPGNGGNIEPSNYFEVEAASDYEESIAGCQLTAGIGDTLDALPGNRVGPTKQGTKDLIALDPNATIDSNGVITGSCCAESPRVVAIAVYDPQEYAAAGYPKGSTFSLTIVNILSMFIKSVDANSKITGVFIEKSDDLDEGSAAPGPITGTSFLTMVRLVR